MLRIQRKQSHVDIFVTSFATTEKNQTCNLAIFFFRISVILSKNLKHAEKLFYQYYKNSLSSKIFTTGRFLCKIPSKILLRSVAFKMVTV